MSRKVGAVVIGEGTSFCVWAPRRHTVRVILMDAQGKQKDQVILQRDEQGYFHGTSAGASAGDLYWFEVDNESKRYPDPASRFQPQGVHGPSRVVDPGQYSWQDHSWRGVELPGQVLYELHIGTFTPEGTWAAAMERLPHLRDTGVTVVEVMPVSEFPGEFGWGYDGVYWYAPTRAYGRPDDFRAFVDHAHRLGLAVILDVVYNHFGPTGNYMAAFTPHFVSHRHPTDWGEAINYDDKHANPVRQFAIDNAAHWISEYHLDGLRLDATQAIFDDSRPHILTEITQAARLAAGDRSVLLFAENESQLVCHVEPLEQDGYGMDGLWNDDFHHACRVAATGHAEFYYGDYSGSAQELLSAIRWGYLYQGQWNGRQQRYRGTPSRRIASRHFVHFLQNHDQVANSTHGLRTHLLTTPGRFRALTALLLLGPQTPMLFMGQEFAASNPFQFFADHEVDIANLVRDGRWEFLRQFPRAAGFGSSSGLPDPSSEETFRASKLNWSERERHQEILLLHRDLLKLRREDPVFARQDGRQLDGAVVNQEAFLLRWFDPDGDDRLMLLNLGRDLHLAPSVQPLLASPQGRRWTLCWSSDDPKYGGSGTAMLNTREWFLPGHAAEVLRAADRHEADEA